MSLEQQQGQERAFGWIIDGADVVDALNRKAADPSVPPAERVVAAYRAEGAQMAVDAMKQALVAGLPACS